MITQAFAEATDGVILALIVSIALPFLTLVAVESTRGSSRGPCGSFSLIGSLSQMMGISLILPFIWLPSLTWSQPAAKANNPELFSKVSLGSPTVINRIAIGLFLTASVALLLNPKNPVNFEIIVAIFQYLPTVLPLLWASFTLSKLANKKSTTIPEAQASSDRAIHIYYAIGIITSILYIYSCLVPLSLPLEDFLPSVYNLAKFAISHPSDRGQLMNWFLFGEWISVSITSSIFIAFESAVLGDGWVLAPFLFLARGLLIGNGASLMLFAVWREKKIMERLRAALKGKKRE
ncbi:UNVERIFIED_CONTAM: hypothetical protein HDU68_001538 [Siphonaria sp. JEL0065]|nr:hypothetical protein HDU68_001538 [Siphonaria sp. JEL0065]